MADPKMPEFVVYSVREREGAKDVWTRIGAAFKHEKADSGFTLLLDALPLGRKIVLMPPRPEDEKPSK